MPSFAFSIVEIFCFLVFCCALFTSSVLLYRRGSNRQEVDFMLQLIFELFYNFDIGGVNDYILSMFDTASDVLVPVALVLMAITGTLTVYMFNVFTGLIQRILNREQVRFMIDVLYKFMFGSDFPEVLGLDPAISASIRILAQLECMLVALYIVFIFVYFLVCVLKKNKRNILQEVPHELVY